VITFTSPIAAESALSCVVTDDREAAQQVRKLDTTDRSNHGYAVKIAWEMNES